jgi:hypothetical protein
MDSLTDQIDLILKQYDKISPDDVIFLQSVQSLNVSAYKQLSDQIINTIRTERDDVDNLLGAMMSQYSTALTNALKNPDGPPNSEVETIAVEEITSTEHRSSGTTHKRSMRNVYAYIASDYENRCVAAIEESFDATDRTTHTAKYYVRQCRRKRATIADVKHCDSTVKNSGSYCRQHECYPPILYYNNRDSTPVYRKDPWKAVDFINSDEEKYAQKVEDYDKSINDDELETFIDKLFADNFEKLKGVRHVNEDLKSINVYMKQLKTTIIDNIKTNVGVLRDLIHTINDTEMESDTDDSYSSFDESE